MMPSVAVVEPTRAVVVVATAATVAISVAVGPSLVEPARSAIAVAAVIRPAAAPRIGMEARSAAAGREFDQGLTAALFERVEREVSSLGRRRQAEPGSDHSSYSQHLHAHHDLNPVGVRPQPRLTGETKGCAPCAEPMLMEARPFRSGNPRSVIRRQHA